MWAESPSEDPSTCSAHLGWHSLPPRQALPPRRGLWQRRTGDFYVSRPAQPSQAPAHHRPWQGPSENPSVGHDAFNAKEKERKLGSDSRA